jgi:signal transduction histidine kinase
VAGLVLNTRDVSERQKVEQAKDAFMTAVSHELRTPLTSIIGYAQTLQRRHASIPPEEQERLLERVVANGQKLSKMIADLLDSDRLKRGILQALRRETDVAALVRETVAGFETRRPVEVIASRANACVDPAMVARIVENLVANADRHTPKGERVLVTVQRAQDGVYIAVEDHGPGIPEEFRAAIFEPFRQGPVVAENSPGIGIGLSLVAQFAALHDGKAWVEPSENGGACFRVFLADPADIPADDGAAPLPSAA